jgi:hypothetical protein
MDWIGVKDDFKNKVFDRWIEADLPRMEAFARYASFCLCVYTSFLLGLACDQISKRKTNLIDMEYLFYLPFCMIFSSKDQSQSQFAHEFLTKEQDFVAASELKRELLWLAEEWDSLGVQKKNERSKRSSSLPPENPSSMTYRLWQKHLRVRNTAKTLELAEEQEKRIIDDMQLYIDAIRERDES